MSDDPEPLPPDVRGLLDQARGPEALEPEVQARIWSRALRTAGVVPPGTNGLAAGAGKVAGAVVVGALLAGGGLLVGRTLSSSSEPAIQPAPVHQENALAEELAILDAAREALRGARHQDALEHAGRHQARFPSGRLAEEREAIAIRSLAGLRRWDEARRRAEAFRSRFPDSLLMPVVDAALAGGP